MNNGDFYTGIKNYYSRVDKAIANHEGSNSKSLPYDNGENLGFILIGILIGSLLRFVKHIYKAIFVAITSIFAIFFSPIAMYAFLLGVLIGFFIKISTIILLILSSGRRGSGSGGGGNSGGGFSGGGGSSGGGGAGD
ncbi:MAG: hypothetical protein PHS92_02865 [Candidatus Gracilibacteria bacterium]|nr:hypothetical protein [Candidatus Gracilibacteria bacterium]